MDTLITLEGFYLITAWDESPYLTHDNGSKQTLAIINQLYSGDITGNADIHYVMSYQVDESAQFVGFETLTCKTKDKQGTLVLQHIGLFANGIAKSQFTVVAGSGTEDFKNVTGTGEYSSTENGQAKYIFKLIF